ncbi:MAG: sugar nucleotide-binding protein, partial [Desulfobacterales bacterium]
GFVGSNIIKVALERYNAAVFSTVYSSLPEGAPGLEYGRVNMLDPQQVRNSVGTFQPNAIIHAAILNNFERMYQDRTLAWQAYVDSTRFLVRAANAVGAKIILVSSDWVFDGTQVEADEFTPPNPINLYGVLKLVAETVVMETAENGAVARVSAVNGVHWFQPNLPLSQNVGLGNLIPAVVNALQRGQRFTVWEGNINMHATPGLASDCAEMMLRIIQRDCRGIFHCCCGQSVSRMELANAAAEIFGLDAELLQTGPPDWTGMVGVPVPFNTSMSARYTAEQLDYTLPNISRLLQIYHQQLETGRLENSELRKRHGNH